MENITILILAAGASSRMQGRDKLLEMVDGVPLLRLQVQRALATGFPVYVALSAPDHPRANIISDLDATPLIAPHAADGMGVTLRETVAQLPVCDGFLVVLADLVALETPDLQQVLSAPARHPGNLVWRGATRAGKPGHPILFDASLRPQFAAFSGDTGGAPLLKTLKAQTHLEPLPDNRALLDLDTPEDWDAWRSR